MGLLAKFGYAETDDRPEHAEPAGSVGNAGGWVEFCAWVDGLPLEGNEFVVDVAEHSLVADIRGAAEQLGRLLAEPQPGLSRAGREVAEALLAALCRPHRGAAALFIADEYAEV